MERMKTARNVGIVLLIAAAVYFLPGGGRASSTFAAALWVVFGAAMGFFALRLYREQRITLHSLGDRHRGMLYGGLALGAFDYMARSRMWETSLGELAWWALLLGALWALMEVFRYSRTY